MNPEAQKGLERARRESGAMPRPPLDEEDAHFLAIAEERLALAEALREIVEFISATPPDFRSLLGVQNIEGIAERALEQIGREEESGAVGRIDYPGDGAI